MYQALVCKINNIRKHPNADRLRLATVQGFQIIVGPEQEEGELGIFFASDGQLSHDFCMANNLYRKNPLTGEAMGGFFEENRRVRAIKLRGEYSEGFWIPLRSLDYLGTQSVKEGDTFTSINGQEICQKYYTPATCRAMQRNGKTRKNVKKRSKQISFPNFHEHYDTSQLRHNIHRIPEDALIYITEKVHGTSQRTGRHIATGLHQSLWQRLCFWKKKDVYRYVSGSRRRVLQHSMDDGFYVKTDFRKTVHDHIAESGLYKGETLYYEIAGYQASGSPLMGAYDVQDKDIREKYGRKIVFSYGCRHDGKGLGDLYQIFVYRITMTNDDGVEIEYSWPQIQRRCGRLGLSTVPVLDVCMPENRNALLNACRTWLQGSSTICKDHPIEGVVIRVEDCDLFDVFKYKSDVYCDLEGIRKNDIEYVDLEEIS
jgi:hypothetical protein